MALAHSPKIVTDGLVLCLDAANPKSYPGSGNSLSDLVATNNGNIVSGSSFSEDSNGSIVYGSSQSSGVITLSPITAGLNLSNETYTFWAKCLRDRSTVGGGGFSNRVIHYGNYFGNNSGGFGLQLNNFCHYIKGSSSSGWSAVGCSGTGVSIYDTYDWIHYTLQIINNNNIKFYMNNTLIFDRTIADAYTGYGSNSVVIGINMDMSFSNIQLYNRVLSPEEIQQNFQALRGRYGL